MGNKKAVVEEINSDLRIHDSSGKDVYDETKGTSKA
jgi:hypothetical protein